MDIHRPSNSHGFTLHLLMPIIAIIGVAIVGSLLISSSRAATATYSGTCTGTVISTSTKVTTTKYKDCIFQAQELMDAIQREDYKSYHTAIETVPDTFVSGSQHYLTMNSIYSTATAYAVKALPGNGSKNELTNGTSGTWQTLCTDAVGAGLATGGKAANYVLSINTKVTGEYSKYTNANNFKSTCGTTTSGGTSGGSGTTTGPSGTAQPSGSSYGTHALSQWDTALASRTTKPVTWVAWGDSITEGQGASSITDRWLNLSLNALRSKYPTSGVTGGFGYIPAWYGTYGPDSQWSTDPVTSGNAAWNLDSNQMGNGPGLGMLTVTLKSGGSETFKVSGSSIDIMYNYGSGSFTYKIDSGSAVSVSTTGGTGATGSKHVVFSSVGSHTVTISGASGSVDLEGLMTYNGDETKGIRLYDSAQSGATTGEFVAQAKNLAAITANVKADLVTIQFGGNDFDSSDELSPSQVTTNLKTMVSDIRSAATGHEPSIVIMVPYNHTGTNTLGYTWPLYVSAIKAVTTADPTLGLIDLTSFATEGTSSPYLSTTDEAHPNDTGQAKLASLVEGYLED